MRRILIALALALPLAAPAAAGQAPDFSDRPRVGQPLRFTDARGHVFRPKALIVLTDAGALRAKLPAASNDARWEEHLDFSGAPFFGSFFKERLAPGDAAREGLPAGPLFRHGSTLVLEARGTRLPLGELNVVLTANFPGDGAVSYWLGRPAYAAAESPRGAGEPAGTAYVVDGTLVLAGPGRGPLITDWGRLLGNRP